MKKSKRGSSKNPIISKLPMNQQLPSQIRKQLKKHYVNKYHKYSCK